MATAREIITKQIIQSLEKGVIPWKRPWSTVRPMNVDGRPYSGVNMFMLSFLNYTDPRFITKKRCLEMGGRIKYAEFSKSHLVVWYMNNKKTQTNTRTGEEETIFSGRRPMYYQVWNVEQCEGLNLKPLEIPTIEFNPLDKAEEVDRLYISKPKVTHGGDVACYFPMFDKINMPCPEFFHSIEEYYSTKFHEYAHSTGHVSRLNRELNTSKLDGGYAREELVAEMTTAFLFAECGIDSPAVRENNEAYLGSWIQKLQNDPSMLL